MFSPILLYPKMMPYQSNRVSFKAQNEPKNLEPSKQNQNREFGFNQDYNVEPNEDECGCSVVEDSDDEEDEDMD